MKVFQTVTLFILLASGVVQAHGALPPPEWPVPDIKPSGTKTQPVTGVTLGSFHVILETTTFKDILDALGSAPVGQQGDASEFLMWVCYTVPAVHARIWLTSSELGGRKYIDGMVARQIGLGEAENPMCPVPVGQTTIAFIDNGLWLGESVETVKSILGTPNTAPASGIYYLYEGKDGEFDIDSLLAMKVHENRVSELYASHTTTN